MDLLSLPYAGFVLLSVILFQACPPKRRSLMLCAESLLLYGYYSVTSAVVLLVSAIVVFQAARSLERRQGSTARRGILFTAVIVMLLSYLLFIKFLPILREHGHAVSVAGIFLALGVSYYTFKLMGYLIDIYWGKYSAWVNPVDFLAFASFYPQLPAGPIQRAPDFNWLSSGEQTAELMKYGLRRILLGAIKKTVVADQLGSIIGSIDNLQPQHTNMLWISACFYTLEMYFDFAALTDISIGTAALFGIRSPENFALPFFAPNISQFWRRWHMSLTFWLTDYVFTPLRMSLRNFGVWGLILSLTATMTLIGVWHGIAPGFVVFGLVHSVYLIIDSLTASGRARFYRRHHSVERLTNIAGPFFVFGMVTFALVFFRAESMANMQYQVNHLWDGLQSPITSMHDVFYDFGRKRVLLVCFATLSMGLWEYLQSKQWIPRLYHLPRIATPLRWAGYYAALVTVASLHLQSTHFIYVQF